MSESMFSAQTFEHTCKSGRTFKFRELSAWEQMNADSLSDKYQVTLYNRMAMALTAINGEELQPTSGEIQIRKRLEQMSGSKADELFLAFMKAFQPQGEELKKRVNARRLITEIAVLSGDMEWALSLKHSEVLTWYVSLGEAHGGEWDSGDS
jgi:hypothetical protein